jgi:phosphopantothenoylcysteine decarboxylase/phosphopantothenate--cysteine ligase
LQTLSRAPVRSDLFDVGQEGEISHIELADWADLVVLAPATADLLAKWSHGLADELVSTLLLASHAPALAAPAMNVNMWRHPATQANVARLRERGVHFVGPDTGALACGWEGEGRMSEPAAIAAAAEHLLTPPSLRGDVVLVTAGGTREPLDPVRAITNRSSGKMGYAIAEEAARRGAEVILVSAPTALPTPAEVRRIDVETALEMRDAVLAELPRATVVIAAAAVADFRPAQRASHKIKKNALGDAPIQIELVRNPDILAAVGADPTPRVVVGFAAESRDLVAEARRKLGAKGCDLMVANDITRTGAGFEGDTNAVAFVWPGGEVEELAVCPKPEVARALLDRVEKLRGSRG